MKSILLHLSADIGLESRLQAALDIVRRFDAHLTVAQAQPYQDFVAIDAFGGAHLMAEALAASETLRLEAKDRMVTRLSKEDIKWDWQEYSGGVIDMLVTASRFADLIIMSLGSEEAINRGVSRSNIGSVALDSNRPVLAVPQAQNSFGFDHAMIAYDGGEQSMNAIRAALPLLKLASRVDMIEVAEKHSEFPMTDAAEYLSRHGIACDIREVPRGDDTAADTIMKLADKSRPDYLVMGAYSRSRLREAFFGGATRQMLFESPVPLLLAN